MRDSSQSSSAAGGADAPSAASQTASTWRSVVARLASGVALIAGVFSVVVAMLMATSYLQIVRTDPLNSTALAALSARLAAHPEDAVLRQQVRDLDLLARRAFFADQRFRHAGARILAVGVGLFLLSAGLGAALSVSAPNPKLSGKRLEEERAARRSRWATVGAAVGLVALAGWMARGPAWFDRPREGEPAETEVDSVDQHLGSGPRGRGPSREALGSRGFAEGRTMPRAPAEDASDEAALASNWPCFRGPGGIGIARGGGAPTDWDGASGRGIRWKTAVPRAGNSSPVVWGGRVYLTGADAEAREVFAFDADTGRLLWRKRAEGIAGSPAELPKVGEDTGYAAATPATDGKRVCAAFATGDLIGLDPDGNVIWARNLGVPNNPYGYASSPVLYRDCLLVQYDQSDGARIWALDAGSGKTLWEKARDVNAAWASPIVVRTARGTEVILTADPWVISYDPATGNEWWRVDCMGGEIGSSPAFGGGTVFVAKDYIRLAAIDVAHAKVSWEYAEDLPDVASPLATDTLVFLGTSYGVITCLDSKSGTVRWRQEMADGFYGSPVLAGGCVYWVDKSGVTRIFRAADSFSLVGGPPLGERSVCTPAVAGGRIYIRGETNLFCVEGMP